MSNLGVGVMISILSGNAESVNTIKAAIGKKMTGLEMRDEELVFRLEDGTSFMIHDDGQSCCEARYMHTDDNLSDFVGAYFLDAETREAPAVEDEWGETHEIEFLLITTSKGVFTIENHNEHNGYYGGFALRAVPLATSQPAGEGVADG